MAGIVSLDASPILLLFYLFTFLLLKRSVAHTTRGRDGRQEGRECGYYHLHRNLNNSLLHSGSFSLFTIHYSLFTISYSLLRVSAFVVTAATS